MDAIIIQHRNELEEQAARHEQEMKELRAGVETDRESFRAAYDYFTQNYALHADRVCRALCQV